MSRFACALRGIKKQNENVVFLVWSFFDRPDLPFLDFGGFRDPPKSSLDHQNHIKRLRGGAIPDFFFFVKKSIPVKTQLFGIHFGTFLAPLDPNRYIRI